MTTFAIYSKESLLVFAPEYFKAPRQNEPGTRRIPVGPVLADHLNDCSYFVVRRSFRVEKQILKVQHGQRGKPGRLSYCIYYAVRNRDFVVARITWAGGAIEELSAHPDRPSADKALRAAHLAAE